MAKIFNQVDEEQREERANAAKSALSDQNDMDDGRPALTSMVDSVLTDQVVPIDVELDKSAEWWRSYAQDLVGSRVALKATPSSIEAMTREIRQSSISRLNLVPGSTNILVHYDMNWLRKPIPSQVAAEPHAGNYT